MGPVVQEEGADHPQDQGGCADVFNLFNRVNLNNPSVNFNDANYGRIASAGPLRQVQIGLRLEF
jgi:hypothetical protein